MKTFTTRLSSRGQVVIPKELRKGLEEGTPFVVKRGEDAIVLKKIDLEPDWEKIEKDFEEVRRIVKKSGIKPRDLPKIIERVREEIAREKKYQKHQLLL